MIKVIYDAIIKVQVDVDHEKAVDKIMQTYNDDAVQDSAAKENDKTEYLNRQDKKLELIRNSVWLELATCVSSTEVQIERLKILRKSDLFMNNPFATRFIHCKLIQTVFCVVMLTKDILTSK